MGENIYKYKMDFRFLIEIRKKYFCKIFYFKFNLIRKEKIISIVRLERFWDGQILWKNSHFSQMNPNCRDFDMTRTFNNDGQEQDTERPISQ